MKTIKTRNLFLVSLCIGFILAYNSLEAQISKGGTPPSLDHNTSKRIENLNQIRLGVYFGSALSIRDVAFSHSANFNINCKQHGFFLGPIISNAVIYSPYRSKEFGNKIKLGFRTGYKYYLLRSTNNFNIFIQYELIYSGRAKAALVSHYYIKNVQHERVINQETSSLFNLIGTGIDIDLTPKTGFNLIISSGLENHFEQTDVTGVTSSRYINKNIATYINLGFVYKLL